MAEDLMETDSEQDDLVFPSKRDAWLVGVLWLVILVSAAGAVFTFTLSLSFVSLFIQEVVWIGVIAFCLSILRSTYYTIKTVSLEVRSGPFRWTIQFEDIEEVVPSRKAWSSAALSMDRLYVHQKGKGGGTYISPENKKVFLENLAERAPSLKREGDRLVRANLEQEESSG
jgi:hypothetical protein